jgi:hypothetical protein
VPDQAWPKSEGFGQLRLYKTTGQTRAFDWGCLECFNYISMVAEIMVAQQILETFVIYEVQDHQMWRAGAVDLKGGEPGVGGTWGSAIKCKGWVLWVLNTYIRPPNMEDEQQHCMV